MKNQNDFLFPPEFPKVTKGMEIDDFILQEKIGQGGMGEVWLAYQVSMDREVALKILPSNLMEDEKCVKRFINEIKNQGKIVHPNVVLAIKSGKAKNVAFLAMRYIYGSDLQQKVDLNGPIKEKKALKLLLPIVDALEFAWEEFKVVHRDIKPANIIVDKHGKPMLLDLGISKSFAEGSSLSLTLTGQIFGTPDFISPEQVLKPKRVDFKTDIYALGATLYLLTTGSTPYEGDTAMAVISKQISEEFPNPRKLNASLSIPFAELIKIMTVKDPKDRHASWKDVKIDFKRVIKGLPCKKHFVLQSKNEFKKKSKKKPKKESKKVPKKKPEKEIITPSTKRIEIKNNPLFLAIAILIFIIVFLTGCIAGCLISGL